MLKEDKKKSSIIQKLPFISSLRNKANPIEKQWPTSTGQILDRKRIIYAIVTLLEIFAPQRELSLVTLGLHDV